MTPVGKHRLKIKQHDAAQKAKTAAIYMYHISAANQQKPINKILAKPDEYVNVGAEIKFYHLYQERKNLGKKGSNISELWYKFQLRQLFTARRFYQFRIQDIILLWGFKTATFPTIT